MRGAITVLFVFGLALVLFGLWGVLTQAGQATFPEMDGMIPFFAGVAGVGCLGVAGVWLLVRLLRARRH